MGVHMGDRADVCRAVCIDNYMGNCRAVVEVFVETFVETIVRFPSILVLRISRASELRIGLLSDNLYSP